MAGRIKITDRQAVVNDSQVSTAIRLDLLLTLRVEEGSSLKRALLEDVWHGIILRIGTFFPRADRGDNPRGRER